MVFFFVGRTSKKKNPGKNLKISPCPPNQQMGGYCFLVFYRLKPLVPPFFFFWFKILTILLGHKSQKVWVGKSLEKKKGKKCFVGASFSRKNFWAPHLTTQKLYVKEKKICPPKPLGRRGFIGFKNFPSEQFFFWKIWMGAPTLGFFCLRGKPDYSPPPPSSAYKAFKDKNFGGGAPPPWGVPKKAFKRVFSFHSFSPKWVPPPPLALGNIKVPLFPKIIGKKNFS